LYFISDWGNALVPIVYPKLASSASVAVTEVLKKAPAKRVGAQKALKKAPVKKTAKKAAPKKAAKKIERVGSDRPIPRAGDSQAIHIRP
jgi:hypothetical protein